MIRFLRRLNLRGRRNERLDREIEFWLKARALSADTTAEPADRFLARQFLNSRSLDDDHYRRIVRTLDDDPEQKLAKLVELRAMRNEAARNW